MTDFIIQYWLQFFFGGVATALTLAYKRLSKRVKEQEAIKDGVLAILHDRLFTAGEYYIPKKEITLSEMKNVEYLYRSYAALGGNGTGKEIWERIQNLPIKK